MVDVTGDDRLIVALDVATRDEAQLLIRKLAKSVSFFKIGHELIFDGGIDLARQLKDEGKRVFLDMKFLDIETTLHRAVANAARLGIDFLTIHGQDRRSVKAAVDGKGDSAMKLLAVSVLTNLTDLDIAEQGFGLSVRELVQHRAALAIASGADGIIASSWEARQLRSALGLGALIVTPGIRLPGGDTADQVRFAGPHDAMEAGADHIVVGRPITRAVDPARAAAEFIALLPER